MNFFRPPRLYSLSIDAIAQDQPHGDVLTMKADPAEP